MSQELVAIAMIRGAIGLEGYCAVETFGETFASLKPPVAVVIGTDADSREVVLEKMQLRPRGYVALFSVAHDRTGAEMLNGERIYIDQKSLPPLGEGEFYHFELEGMSVVADSTGETVGVVKNVVNLPSTDAFEVTLDNGHEVLIPYIEDAVVRVENKTGRIIVRWSYLEELL
ncbi:MAG: ribosome maturation factor RimM [Chitinispirillaceae bacterium]